MVERLVRQLVILVDIREPRRHILSSLILNIQRVIALAEVGDRRRFLVVGARLAVLILIRSHGSRLRQLLILQLNLVVYLIGDEQIFVYGLGVGFALQHLRLSREGRDVVIWYCL